MKIITGAVLVIVAAALVGLLLALPTMLLWNSLVPALFGLPSISFWQSIGLCLLARFLFGGGNGSSSK